MHDQIAFLLTALLIFVFGLFSKVSERLPITAPMVFVGVGILVGPLGFDLFHVSVNTEIITVLAEITLMLILFTDGSEIDIKTLRQEKSRIAIRLLAIGLPLTMLSGFVIGALMFDSISLWQVALIALILSPTDAALGQAVVKSQLLPEKLKRTISIESGLNDGIALPPILVCMAILSTDLATAQESKNWLNFLLLQLTLGPLVGGLVGWFGGRLVEWASLKGWMSPVFQRMSSISLAVLAFALAEMVHGNGFIAAFIGGVMLGVRTHSIRERIQEFSEAEGQQLSLFIFLVLGMVGVPVFYQHWDFVAVVYALLSLTAIRMLPVAISLIGSGVDWKTRWFIGWFGPRGIASVLYLLMVIGTLKMEGLEYALSVIALVVILSVLLHGVSAVPLVKKYSRSLDTANSET